VRGYVISAESLAGLRPTCPRCGDTPPVVVWVPTWGSRLRWWITRHGFALSAQVESEPCLCRVMPSVDNKEN
jgi:hypothetical protein